MSEKLTIAEAIRAGVRGAIEGMGKNVTTEATKMVNDKVTKPAIEALGSRLEKAGWGGFGKKDEAAFRAAKSGLAVRFENDERKMFLLRCFEEAVEKLAEKNPPAHKNLVRALGTSYREEDGKNPIGELAIEGMLLECPHESVDTNRDKIITFFTGIFQSDGAMHTIQSTLNAITDLIGGKINEAIMGSFKISQEGLRNLEAIIDEDSERRFGRPGSGKRKWHNFKKKLFR